MHGVKQKTVEVKLFNILTRINEAKTSMEHISCSGTYLIKCTFDSIACNSNKKWNNETRQCECRNYQTCK